MNLPVSNAWDLILPIMPSPYLDHEGLLGPLLAPGVELVSDVHAAVLADLEVVAVHVTRRWPRDVLAVDVVDPPVARAEELPLSLPHEPAHRAPQVRTGAAQDV